MAITNNVYGRFSANIMGGETAGESIAVDWLSHTIKCALFKSTYELTASRLDADESYSVIIADEVATGAGYTTGGETLANKTVTYDTGTNTTKFDADNPTWTGLTKADVRYAIVYDDSDSTKVIIDVIDFETTRSPIDSTLTVQFAAAGVVTIAVS